MIEPMKKTTIVCLAQDQAQSLKRLQKLAVMHIIPVSAPTSARLDELRRRQSQVEGLMFRLDEYKDQPVPQDATAATDAQECLENALAAVEEVRSGTERLRQLEAAMAQLAPWGQFDFAVPKQLAALGWNTILCCCSNGEEVKLPEDAVVAEVANVSGKRYFAVFTQKEPSQLRLPVASFPCGSDLKQLEGEIVAQKSKLEAAQNDLAIHAALNRQLLAQASEALVGELSFEQARRSMGEAGQELLWLTGFVPQSRLDELRGVAQQEGWAIRYEDVDPEDPAVPTQLEVRRPFGIAKIVLDFIGLVPGYSEIDVSVSVLVFLSLFSGMLVGDAGYGALFTIISAAGLYCANRRKDQSKAAAMRLFLVISLCVLGWGALSGNWFGLSWGGISWLTDDKDSRNIKLLCFFIGAGHMILAHLWKSAVVHNLRERLNNIGWALFMCGNFFTVKGMLVDNGDFGDFTIPTYIYIAGATLILLFGVRWTKVAEIINAPFTFISSFGDMLSYIRLFAVGISSLEIARAFNEMSAAMWQDNLWMLPVGLLMLLFGHLLNIGLAMMGVLAHGIRLNTLEFSSHIGLEWKGRQYAPFK